MKYIIPILFVSLFIFGCGQGFNTAPTNDSTLTTIPSAQSQKKPSQTGCNTPTGISISKPQFFYSLDTVNCKDSVFEMFFNIQATNFCLVDFYLNDTLVWETGTTGGNKNTQNIGIAFSTSSCLYLQRFKTYTMKAKTNCGVIGDQQIYSDYSQPFTFNTK